MSTTSAPFGLKPINQFWGGGVPTRLGYNASGIASGYTTAIFQNTPVKLATTGVIQAVGSTEDFIGAFGGCIYTPVGQRPQYSNQWPASTVLSTNTTAYATYTQDPGMLYQIQADGSLAQSSIGDQANFTSVGSGNTITGLSTATMNSTLAGAGTQAQLRVIGLALEADNAWGDTYVQAQVQIAAHQFVSNKVAI